MSINSCIEDLSNEIFYDIFDYLNGIDISCSFSNLNSRFQTFICNPSFLFKIKFSSSLSDQQFLTYWKQISTINKNQILTFNFYSTLADIDSFLPTYFIDSSLNCLKSITLDYVEDNTLLLLLKQFISLPCLLSLNIQLHDNMEDKISALESVWLKSISRSSENDQLSPIQYFNIDHSCTFEDLAILTSYTPKISYLKFEQLALIDAKDEIILSIPFDNLTHLSMDLTRFEYDTFLMFMKTVGSKLMVLNLIVRLDFVIYLVSTLWERLISENMPQLRKFSLTFYEVITNDDDGNYLWPSNQFITSFWIERKWVFYATMNNYHIIYSICPYKRSWYDSVEIDLNSMISNEENFISTSSKLTIEELDFSECVKSFDENINWIRDTTRIYHLELPKEQISIRTLIDLINFLPDLHSLQVWSLSLVKQKRSSAKEIKYCNDIKIHNRITKVYIENPIDIKEIFDLIDLFPRMKYLQINWPNNFNIRAFIRINLSRILKRSSDEFRSLGFIIKLADDPLINKLKNIIDSKKLLCNYTIKRVSETIYLKWK